MEGSTKVSACPGNLGQAAELMGDRLGEVSYALRPLLAILRNQPTAGALSPSELVQFELLALRGRWVMRLIEGVVSTAERHVSATAAAPGLRAAA